MLRSLKDFNRYAVSATDGDIGVVGDFLLDDERWVVRYLVVETGGLLEGRVDVLISPISFRHTEVTSRRFHLALTRDKIKNSPRVDTDQPVSRQYERDYNGYYGHASYWGSAGLWGVGTYPLMLATSPSRQASDKALGDAHLRSARELRGYHVQGSDEAIGHVEDLVVDDETWEVRYLVVDTSNWWFGKSVLVAPHWASAVSWEERKVHMDLRREEIKNSPEWNAGSAISREYEARLYEHYGRPRYSGAPVRRAEAPPLHHAGERPE